MRQNNNCCNYEILPFAPEHVGAVAEIELSCFTQPWSHSAFESELANPPATYFVAAEGQKIVGFAGVHLILDEGYITNIAVAEGHRGKGHAHRLLKALEDHCSGHGAQLITLEVRVGNSPAIALYKSHGFVVLGKRKNFYEEPTEDAYIMTKFLNTKEVDSL